MCLRVFSGQPGLEHIFSSTVTPEGCRNPLPSVSVFFPTRSLWPWSPVGAACGAGAPRGCTWWVWDRGFLLQFSHPRGAVTREARRMRQGCTAQRKLLLLQEAWTSRSAPQTRGRWLPALEGACRQNTPFPLFFPRAASLTCTKQKCPTVRLFTSEGYEALRGGRMMK